jgi:Cysteine synthase
MTMSLPTGIRDGFNASIGNTPLIRLHGPSEATGCHILGKQSS